MTLYDKINYACEHGYHVIVKDMEDNRYCIISPFKDCDGNWRDSSWGDSIDMSKNYIGLNHGSNSTYWNTRDTKIVGYWVSEYKPFKVGDTVINQLGKIETLDYAIFTPSKYYNPYFGDEAEQSSDDDIITLNGKRYKRIEE